jgi:hypothetical protein
LRYSTSDSASRSGRRAAALGHALQCRAQALARHRLGQVVDRVQLEGAYCMLRLCGDEDHAGRLRLAAQRGRQLHAVKAGQADVQQQQVAMPAAQQGQGLLRIPGFADDFAGRIGAVLQQRTQAHTGQRLVVDQQDSQRRHGDCHMGTMMRARNSPPSRQTSH